MDFRKVILKAIRWVRDSRAQIWVGVQWAAVMTILFTPAWNDRFANNHPELHSNRRLASSVTSAVDSGISSEVLSLPDWNEVNKKMFAGARQVRFEWRSIKSRDPAATAHEDEYAPVALERLHKDGLGVQETISLIPSDGGGVYVSTYVELADGVNIFRARYLNKHGKHFAHEFLVVLKR